MICLSTSFLLFAFSYVQAIPYLIDDTFGYGRRFDGIGGLSGGGATSKLLVNYPEKQRNEILDYLFKPNFAASVHILKVEVGGDSQSTDGTESSHMHESWDENYHRGYEWWIMVEAKKRNPDIKLYCLPWAFPGWLGNGTRNPFHNPELTATYIIKFIKGAKTHYNLTFDFVGIWNEKPYDVTYIKTLRKMLDGNSLQHVRIVAADFGTWGIAVDMLKDAELAAAIDYIGVHYPGTYTTVEALKTGKQLWASEDYSTFNDNVGAGCWARILNQNYVNGMMTSTISWNLIASYYPSLPYFRDGLMTAIEPWSGNYTVESPIWVTAHTTQFTNIGWKYLLHGSGVDKLFEGGSMVTLTSPDKKDLTIIIETMTHDHSVCIRPYLPPYKVKAQTIRLQFKGGYAHIASLNVWHSKLGFGGNQTVLFKKLDPVKLINSELELEVGLDEIYTLTTLNVGQKGEYPPPPASQPFPLPYKDNFEEYAEHQEPNNLAQQTGAYEVIATSSNNKILRQMVMQRPVYWCQADLVNLSSSIFGNHLWADIYIEVEASLNVANATDGVFVAARVDKGGCEVIFAKGIYFFVFPSKQHYQVTSDLARTKEITSGKISNFTTWNKLSLLIKDGEATGALNGISTFKISVPDKPASGFVGLGTSSFGIADFDNLLISSAADGELAMKDAQFNRNSIKNHQKSKDTLYFEPYMNINDQP